MTRVPFTLVVAALALAAALSGCATTRNGKPGVADGVTADADASAAAIKGTRVVATGTRLSRPEDPLALRVPAPG